VLAREREEDEKWRKMMMDKFAEDDRLGTVPVRTTHSHEDQMVLF
jgi:hypothetical protein